MNKISVLLVDDHSVVRQGLRALLHSEVDIEVVGEAQTGREGVQMAKTLLPDVVVMDIAMPSLNGLEATRQISRDVPSTKVLVLSSYGDAEYVRQLTDAGATGYLIKQGASDELVTAIRQAKLGNSFFSPTVSKHLVNGFRESLLQGRPQKKAAVVLTHREAEVLQLIAEGLANKQIASELFISIKTVEKHRQQVMNKLHIHCIAGLTQYAITNRVVESSVVMELV